MFGTRTLPIFVKRSKSCLSLNLRPCRVYLPNGMKVVVTERVPIGVVKVSSGNFLIDADGELLAPPKTEDAGLMTINGWDEAKTERAARDNAARIKLFQKMIADWGEFGLRSVSKR